MSYGYQTDDYVPLNLTEVMKRVSQEDIYKMVIGYIPKEHVYCKSPIREDNTPGCYFEWYNGWLWFIDWTEVNPKHHRNCINMVQDRLGLSFFDALKVINKHFKLGLGTDSDVPTSPVKFNIQKKKPKEQEKHEIEFKARPFNNKGDKEFWTRYGISKKQLVEDNVFPIIWYRVYSKTLRSYVVIRPQTRSYCIYNFGGETKIYTPEATSKKGKWISNASQNAIGGIDSLSLSGEVLVISKSYKDYRVLRNEGVSCIWLQNEGMLPSEEAILPVLTRFNRIVILFDNDRAGIKASQRVKEHLDEMITDKTETLTLPVSLLEEGITDPSDLYYRKGQKELSKFVNKWKLSQK